MSICCLSMKFLLDSPLGRTGQSTPTWSPACPCWPLSRRSLARSSPGRTSSSWPPPPPWRSRPTSRSPSAPSAGLTLRTGRAGGSWSRVSGFEVCLYCPGFNWKFPPQWSDQRDSGTIEGLHLSQRTYQQTICCPAGSRILSGPVNRLWWILLSAKHISNFNNNFTLHAFIKCLL